jgi:hypothetical protein
MMYGESLAEDARYWKASPRPHRIAIGDRAAQLRRDYPASAHADDASLLLG